MNNVSMITDECLNDLLSQSRKLKKLQDAIMALEPMCLEFEEAMDGLGVWQEYKRLKEVLKDVQK